MSDLPILFTAAMVRGLLREIENPGTGKTQTRRLLKLPTKTFSGGPIYERPDMGGWATTTSGGGGSFTIGRGGERIPAPERPALWHQTTGVCIVPRLTVGDRLYVREAYRVSNKHDATKASLLTPRSMTVMFAAGGSMGGTNDPHPKDRLRTAAEYTSDLSYPGPTLPDWAGKLRPGIFLPKWASRITLIVDEVRVQRLQEISEADAIAEGIERDEFGWRCYSPEPKAQYTWADPRESYRTLWESINGAGSWAANPFVVAYTFRPFLSNIDAMEKACAA
jgi:hypothetical protein